MLKVHDLRLIVSQQEAKGPFHSGVQQASQKRGYRPMAAKAPGDGGDRQTLPGFSVGRTCRRIAGEKPQGVAAARQAADEIAGVNFRSGHIARQETMRYMQEAHCQKCPSSWLYTPRICS